MADLFKTLNESKWNVFDSEFFLLNRRWFDQWKDYIQYDYILHKIVTELRPIHHLSVNKIMLQGKTHPGEITNY